MKLFIFMGIFSLPLTFKSNLCHRFKLEKVPQKYPQKCPPFLGVGDDFNYEKKFN
jgi:hypothetical protein